MRRVLLAAIFASNCATASIKNVTVLEESWSDALEQVRPKAAFDLQCPAEALDFTILTTQRLLDGVVPSTIGVRGCGKQATWIRQSRKGLVSWIAERAATATESNNPP